MLGRKLVRALFRDCSALAKFSGKHKLFVRLPNKTVRFVAPYGRFTISFGEQQYDSLRILGLHFFATLILLRARPIWSAMSVSSR